MLILKYLFTYFETAENVSKVQVTVRLKNDYYY